MANSRVIERRIVDDRRLIGVRHDGGVGPSIRGSLRLRSEAQAWAGGDDPRCCLEERVVALRRALRRSASIAALFINSRCAGFTWERWYGVGGGAPGGRAALV